MWYTLTGNFGNLLPIGYWSKTTLIRKYHRRSLDLKLSDDKPNKNKRKSSHEKSTRLKCSQSNRVLCNKPISQLKCQSADTDQDEEGENYFYDEEAVVEKSDGDQVEVDDDDDDDEDEDDVSCSGESEDDEDEERDVEEVASTRNECCDAVDPIEFDQLDDDDELKEQLDMHAMVLSRSALGDEPIITAEQVLDEIDSMIKLEVSSPPY